MTRTIAIVCSLLILLSACNPQSATATPQGAVSRGLPTLEPVSLPVSESWSVELVAQAEQLSAPSFVYVDETPIFTWTGSAGREARHFSRGLNSRSQIMALQAYFPMQQALFATDNGVLMLWLDRTQSDFELRLQVGGFNDFGIAEIAPIALSNQMTRNFSALEIEENLVRVVWSGGVGQVMNLYLHQVDSQGRPVEGNRLRIDADYPALLQDETGAVHLFWLENNQRDVYYGRFDEASSPVLTDIRRVASADISGTDSIEHFTVGYDGTVATLLWNIRHSDNSRTVLMSHGQLAEERFTIPIPLNTPDGQSVQWANVPTGIHSPLPIVVNAEDELAILWMDNTTLADIETITTSGVLLGVPNIQQAEGIIGVSWSMPSDEDYANLLYASRGTE